MFSVLGDTRYHPKGSWVVLAENAAKLLVAFEPIMRGMDFLVETRSASACVSGRSSFRTLRADGLIDQWEALARDDGAVFLKERLDALGKRRAEIEAALEELNMAVEEIDRESFDRDLIMTALGRFAEVFEGMAPYQQKELIRLVVHKVVVSREAMELGLYARMPEMRAVPPTRSRSQTPNWLPGLVSGSAILRDLTAMTWQRRRHGRVTLAPA